LIGDAGKSRRPVVGIGRLGASLGRLARKGSIMSQLRTVLSGRQFLESPRWRDGALWVADWAAHEALRVGPDGKAEVVARTNSFPMCLEHLPDGRLIIVDSAERRLARLERDGSLVTHADLSGLSERRAIGNDIV